MSAPITGIDHLLVGVRDLEAARERYRRLGFTCTPRGSHIGWGTANYCIMFTHDYIELLGIVDAQKFTNNLDRFLEGGEGMLGLAFRTADADAVKAAFDAADVSAEGPKDLARNLELPEGTVLPRFKLVFPAAETFPAMRAFVCQHLTPAMIRRPEWLEHLNGAVDLASATAVVAEPAALAPAYARLFGSAACTGNDDGLSVRVGRHKLIFLNLEAAAALYPDLAPKTPPKDQRLLAQCVLVDDLDGTAAFLDSKRVPFSSPADGILRVPPEEATGVVLEFRAERD